jgi:hypothetical protein
MRAYKTTYYYELQLQKLLKELDTLTLEEIKERVKEILSNE